MKKLYLLFILIFFAGCSLDTIIDSNKEPPTEDTAQKTKTTSEETAAEVYYVKAITSHYTHVNENSQTEMVVWINGTSGHVKEVFCAFAPEVVLTGNNETGWTGVYKIQVGEKYEEFLMGETSYLCTALE